MSCKQALVEWSEAGARVGCKDAAAPGRVGPVWGCVCAHQPLLCVCATDGRLEVVACTVEEAGVRHERPRGVQTRVVGPIGASLGPSGGAACAVLVLVTCLFIPHERVETILCTLVAAQLRDWREPAAGPAAAGAAVIGRMGIVLEKCRL